MWCANGTAEFLEKIIGVFDKSVHVNFQAEEYRRSFVEDKAAFSRVHRSPYGIYQFQIIVKGKGDPGGPFVTYPFVTLLLHIFLFVGCESFAIRLEKKQFPNRTILIFIAVPIL
jgi:hypothetical protein